MRGNVKSLLFRLFWGAGLFIILIAINYLAVKYSLRWDMTNTKQHTLTTETKNILKNLKRDVKLTAFYVGIPPKYLEDLLAEYERRSHLSAGHITTEIIDPIVQIGYAAQFGNVIHGKEQKVIVQSGKERKDVDFSESPLTEEMLTNAIIKVTRPVRKIYFLTGHGEYNTHDQGDNGYSIFDQLLKNNNATTIPLMLGMKGEIPADCDVLVIAGPKNPLTEKEEKIIKEYLEKGGEALFLIESSPVGTLDQPLSQSDQLKNPSLNSILNEWGMKVGNDIVVDLESHVSGDVGCPATKNYPPHDAIVNNLDYTFFIRPRSISILDNRRSTVKVAPLVLTASSKQSWAETDKTLQVKFDELFDIPGPVVIAAVVWEPKDNDKQSDTRIIVFTDADFLANNFINQYNNAQLGLKTIQWLSDMEDTVLMKDKTIKVERLDLTSQQLKTLTLILIAMPLLIIVGGIVMWLKQAS